MKKYNKCLLLLIIYLILLASSCNDSNKNAYLTSIELIKEADKLD